MSSTRLDSGSSRLSKILENRIHPNAPTPIISQYEAQAWSGDQPGGQSHHWDLWNVHGYYPEPAFHSICKDEYHRHSLVWSNYNPARFDVNFFNWKTVNSKYPLTLKQFFIKNQIDTPKFLKQGRSKFRPEFCHPANRFVGMLSRHGKVSRLKLYYLWVYLQLARELAPSSYPLSTLNGSNVMFNLSLNLSSEPFLSILKTSGSSPLLWNLAKTNAEDLISVRSKFEHRLHEKSIDLNTYTPFYNLLFDRLRGYFPIFAMKPRRVDKLRYKHSRGKSGKYVVEWKYIPQYKRLDVVLRWLVDDVIMQKSSKFRFQILKSLRLLLMSPSEHTVHKNRSYVHYHVFTRYKQTLVRTLRKV